MKPQLLALSRRYHAALQKHLQGKPKSSVQPARRLGEHAVTLGLETLDLARIHKAALTEVMPVGAPSAAKDQLIKRACVFFAEAISPIEKTHRAGVEASAVLNRRKEALNQRTAQLATANRRLKQGIIQRKTAEAALRKSNQHHAKSLRESRHLQKHLQSLTHQILSAQEMDRERISHDLRDEIAQTLLGINVRLVTLKKGVVSGREGFAKEIASTQKLVEKSVKTINRFAREFSVQT